MHHEPVDDGALALVDFYFWPHHVPGATLDASVRAALPHADLVYGGADGMGVVVDGDRLELHGAVPITPQPAGVDRPA